MERQPQGQRGVERDGLVGVLSPVRDSGLPTRELKRAGRMRGLVPTMRSRQRPRLPEIYGRRAGMGAFMTMASWAIGMAANTGPNPESRRMHRERLLRKWQQFSFEIIRETTP